MQECLTLEEINLQSNKLPYIPDFGALPNLKTLIMEGNSVANCTFPISFKTSTSLQKIVLSGNNIEHLSSDTFTALEGRSLSSLALNRNKIKTASENIFLPLKSVQSLKLGSNPIDGPELKTIIRSMKGMTVVALDISELNLEGDLLKDTFSLLSNTAINTLNLKQNSIKVLHNHVFTGLNRLVSLDLTSCKVHVTYKESFKGLNSLNNLVLNKNMLTEIPENLPASLQNLYMDDNQIISIPNNIFIKQADLRRLSIRNNKILTLMQDSFNGLGSLEQLHLCQNNINTIPGLTFNPLVALTDLDLSKNNLVNIQMASGRFVSQGALRYLNLADNKCSYLQPDVFKYMKSLRELHLEGNNLGDVFVGDVNGTIFLSLTKVELLYLQDNALHSIPGPTFQNLVSMKTLNISRNKITGWDDELFSTTTNLESLDSSSNLIATLHDGKLKYFNNLKFLNLSGNPFMCDCDLRNFRDWINDTAISLTDISSYTCYGPPDWKNKPLLAFNRNNINCDHYTLWMVLVTCACVAVSNIGAAGVLYKKRWYIKLFIYKKARKFNWHENYQAVKDEDNEKRFDAYISYAEDDEEWVRENLMPGIDNGKLGDLDFGGKYRLYFADRDCVPGICLLYNVLKHKITVHCLMLSYNLNSRIIMNNKIFYEISSFMDGK